MKITDDENNGNHYLYIMYAKGISSVNYMQLHQGHQEYQHKATSTVNQLTLWLPTA